MIGARVIDLAKYRSGYIIDESRSGISWVIEWHNFRVERVRKDLIDKKYEVTIGE